MTAGLPVLRPRPPADVPSLASAISAAADALAGATGVTLVLNDPQRATRSDSVLGPLAPTLAGRRVRALIATGSHHFPPAARAAFEHPLRRLMPVEDIAWHDDGAADLADIGGWRGHPWLLDEAFALLAIGSCEMHYFAGITGAHKTVTLGCAAHADIEANHGGALSPDAAPGVLAGNPVHDGVAAMVRQLTARRPVTAVNLLQVGARLVGAAAGGPLDALDALAEATRAAYSCPIDAPADALVLEVDGPLAGSFYQADKAVKNSEHAVRDGGTIVLCAACPDGVGQDQFMDLLRRCRTYDAAAAEMARRGYRLGDHKAVKLRYLTDRRGVRVFVVGSAIAPADLSDLGFRAASTVAGALAAAGIDPAIDRVFRVADAGNTCVTAAWPVSRGCPRR